PGGRVELAGVYLLFDLLQHLRREIRLHVAERCAPELRELDRVLAGERDVGDERLPHGVAPASIHRPRRRRSASVMCVVLPSGIVRVSTATALIRAACAAISAGVSRRMPSGAVLKSGLFGSAAWQKAHRFSTIGCICTNVTVPPPVAGFVSSGLIASASARSATAAPAGIHQTVRPVCRRLKKCLIQAPITISATRISH